MNINEVYCHTCGKYFSSLYQFCPYCGQSVNKNEMSLIPDFDSIVNALSDSALELYRKKEYDEAFSIYYYLAVNGNIEGQYKVGYFYENGFCVEKNFNKAIDWYKRAIMPHAVLNKFSGDEDINSAAIICAKAGLGRIYDNGDEEKLVDVFNFYHDVFVNDISEESGISEDVDIYKISFRLGEMYELGLGTSVDYDKAIDCYDTIYSSESSYRIGRIYCNDNYLGKDIDTAVSYLESASLHNNVDAEKLLISIYENNEDYNDGSVYSLYSLGKKFYYGNIINKNHEKAFSLFEKAALNEYTRALLLLGDMYYNGDSCSEDKEKAFDCYNKALKIEDSDDYFYSELIKVKSRAFFRLGRCYMHGHGVEINIDKAIFYFNKSIEAHLYVSDSLRCLGEIYASNDYYKEDLLMVQKMYVDLAKSVYINLFCAVFNLNSHNFEKSYIIVDTFKEVVDDCLEIIGGRRADVLKMRFGLNDLIPRTLEQIANYYHENQKVIKNMESLGLIKLRKLIIKKEFICDCLYDWNSNYFVNDKLNIVKNL